MKLAVSFIFFFLFSFLEIKVKASNPTLQSPENCFSSKTAPCIFSSGNKVLRLQEEGTILNLKENTTMERLKSGQLEFMSGIAWIQNHKPLQIQTVYGEIKSENGEVWIVEKDNKIFVRNIVGSVRVRINSNELEVPEGFQVWISGKDSFGKNIYGVPEIIQIENHLKLWSELFAGSREEFKEKILLLKNLYRQTRSVSSELYQKIADHHAVTNADRKKAELAAAQRRQLYLHEIRKLYFEKVFER